MNLLKHLYFLLCLLIFSNLLQGQQQNVKLTQYDVADGLSQSTIQVIFQDKTGFIWFGTEEGLNRFDGYDFKVYKNIPQNKNSLSSSNVRSIYEDDDGNLWIGTSQGLNLYDRKRDIFIQNPKWPKNNISSIIKDDFNNLWVGSFGGLYYIDIKNDSVIAYQPNNFIRDSGYISSGVVNGLYIDSRRNIWIGTNRGLNLYNKEMNSFINYYHNSNPGSLIDDNVRLIAEDKEGRLWIATAAGLDLFTNASEYPAKGVLKHFQYQRENQDGL